MNEIKGSRFAWLRRAWIKTGQLKSAQYGSISLEAAVVFPWLLAVLLVFVNFLKVTMVYVAMDHAVSETAKQLATQAYPLKYLKQPKLAFLEGLQAELVTKLLQGEGVKKLVQEEIIEFYPLGNLRQEDFRITRLHVYNPFPTNEQVAEANHAVQAKQAVRSKELTEAKQFVQTKQIVLAKEDVFLQVEYRVQLHIPFLPAREILLSNAALERAWADD